MARQLEILKPNLNVWNALTIKFKSCELDISFSCEKALVAFLICLTWSAKSINPDVYFIKRRQDIYWSILKAKLRTVAQQNDMSCSVGLLLADGILNYVNSMKTKGRNEDRFYKKSIDAILSQSSKIAELEYKKGNIT